ncbi:MAG: hypothetical protein Q9160_001231 [Pyrenula sp. 1 TL-2023]
MPPKSKPKAKPVRAPAAKADQPAELILTISNFFTSTLCRDYASFLSNLPLTTTAVQPKRGHAVRVNDRFQIDDKAFAERLWSTTALKDLIMNHDDPATWGGEVLGLNPNIRIYRYKPGQFFDRHYDDSNNLMFGTPPVQAKTTWTLLIYLTRCEGGETAFYPEGTKKNPNPNPVEVGIEVGMALLHRHGKDCMLHEGKEVLKGEKWVIRSDLVVRR